MATKETKIITDTDLVNQFAAEAMEEPEAVIETVVPSGPVVKLPGGFSKDGTVINTAEVRELNGMDEEAIANATTTGRALGILLQRGLVKIGDVDVTKDDLDKMLSGDRDTVLLAIRKVTFGETVDYDVVCPNCSSDQLTTIHLTDDVPVKVLDSYEDRVWKVETKKGIVSVALPTGITQRKLLENADKTAAELNTILLSGCVLDVNGEPSVGASTVLKLGMADRAKIVNDIIDRNPGPRLGEVKKACKACGEDIRLPLSLIDLFRL